MPFTRLLESFGAYNKEPYQYLTRTTMESLITELLHEIFHSIAYECNLPGKQGHSSFKRPARDLVSLSLVNHRIREIALCLLLKHVQIDRNSKAVRLLGWCQSYPRLAKLVKYVIHCLGSMFPDIFT